jgi:hypothetical protein
VEGRMFVFRESLSLFSISRYLHNEPTRKKNQHTHTDQDTAHGKHTNPDREPGEHTNPHKHKHIQTQNKHTTHTLENLEKEKVSVKRVLLMGYERGAPT